MKIYIAGKMTGLTKDEMSQWRKELADKIRYQVSHSSMCFPTIIDPCMYYNTKDIDAWDADKEYIRWELRHVKSADLIIVGVSEDMNSIGTMAEMTMAYDHDIPILLYDRYSGSEGVKRLHPFVWYFADKYFTDIDALVEYVVSYYK